jgi:hypothetical protein
MENTVTCPKCNLDSAYFDGVIFICPDCNHEWEDMLANKPGNISSTPMGKTNFESLIKLKEPFFRLTHGKLYDCKLETDRGIETMSIMPLAFEEGRNRQFVMIDAIRLFTKNPDIVRQIIKMDFNYIWNDGILCDYPSEYEALTILCATNNDETLVDNIGAVFFDFREAKTSKS